MDFGDALRALKEDKKVARRGWNGRGMYLYLTDGRTIPSKDWVERTPSQGLTDHEKITGDVEILPHIDMYTVNRDGRRGRLCGWLASQTDMLSDDWEIVD